MRKAPSERANRASQSCAPVPGSRAKRRSRDRFGSAAGPERAVVGAALVLGAVPAAGVGTCVPARHLRPARRLRPAPRWCPRLRPAGGAAPGRRGTGVRRDTCGRRGACIRRRHRAAGLAVVLAVVLMWCCGPIAASHVVGRHQGLPSEWTVELYGRPGPARMRGSRPCVQPGPRSDRASGCCNRPCLRPGPPARRARGCYLPTMVNPAARCRCAPPSGRVARTRTCRRPRVRPAARAVVSEAVSPWSACGR